VLYVFCEVNWYFKSLLYGWLCSFETVACSLELFLIFIPGPEPIKAFCMQEHAVKLFIAVKSKRIMHCLSELKVVIAYASNRAPAFTGSRIIRRDDPGRLDESSRRLIKRTSHLYSHQVTIHCYSPPASSLYLLGSRSIFCNYNTS